MKKTMVLSSVMVLVILLALAVAPGLAQGPVGTAFTYQGRLTNGGSPVNGTCDFAFSLWDSLSNPTGQIGFTQIWTGVMVSEGLFTVQLDFGDNAFTGDARWLQIMVHCPTVSVAYTNLSPRQALTPAPYALALPGLWTQQNATSPNVIGGYSGNSVTSGVYGATIGGGGESGYTNRVTGYHGTVGGGSDNQADGVATAVGGGSSNTASNTCATVGGGGSNEASGSRATVGGGHDNTASGYAATVGGGINNEASGYAATVPGGWHNTAGGDYSFAAGRRAKANNQGCFVWGDSTLADVSCNNDNRTIFRSYGGYYIYTGAGAGMYLAAGGSSWNAVSNRELKENLAPVDAGLLLERLARVEIGTWNYKAQDPAIRHIGPMADDFNALVDGLGGEGLDYINSLDADGVALASIQELYRLYLEQKAENAALRQQVADLQAQNVAQQEQLADLETRLAALEQVVSGGPQVGGGER